MSSKDSGISHDDIILFSKVLLQGDDATKLQVLEFFLDLSAALSNNIGYLINNSEHVYPSLVQLIFSSNPSVSKKAAHVLVNISAEQSNDNSLLSTKIPTADQLVKTDLCQSSAPEDGNCIIPVLIDRIVDVDSHIPYQAAIVLSNLTRYEKTAQKVCDSFLNVAETVEKLVDLAVKMDPKYDNVSFLLANLSQSSDVQKIFMRTNQRLLKKILPLINCGEYMRKLAVISIIRNLCLSAENNELLLDPELDLLVKILLPLAGPEEFDDEDNDKLPLDLQYLPENKTRESCSDLRRMLLEILMQLCSTNVTRDIMRNKNVYVILREYHKWEKDEKCLETCEDLVNILIRTENEIGVDNLKNVEIPSDLMEKFTTTL